MDSGDCARSIFVGSLQHKFRSGDTFASSLRRAKTDTSHESLSSDEKATLKPVLKTAGRVTKSPRSSFTGGREMELADDLGWPKNSNLG